MWLTRGDDGRARGDLLVRVAVDYVTTTRREALALHQLG
jgi:hypothetical protein